jgi:hypothetical protein
MPISQIVTNSIATGAVSAADLAAGAALSNLGSSQLADANMAPGSVIQVVQATTTTGTTTTSTSFVDTNLSASITPSSASSKILAFVSGPLYCGNTGYNTYSITRLVRGSTALLDTNHVTDNGAGSGVGVTMSSSLSISYLDSPATTSSTTYKLQIRLGQTAYSATTTFPFQTGFGSSYTATIILMEIAA